MGDIFYKDTVTIYNRMVTGLMEKEIWYPTLLRNVRLLASESSRLEQEGKKSEGSVKLFIKPYLLPEGTRSYIEPKKWEKLSEEEKASFFTLKSGQDFFVEGDVCEEDCTRDNFFQYMKKTYDKCYLVNSVQEFCLIPHIEAGGV